MYPWVNITMAAIWHRRNIYCYIVLVRTVVSGYHKHALKNWERDYLKVVKNTLKYMYIVVMSFYNDVTRNVSMGQYDINVTSWFSPTVY